jgi:DNA repair protein RadC
LARVGATGLSTAELIALLWGSGVSGRSAVDLAETAIAAHGGLAALSRAGLRELTALPGVGQARAAQLAAAFELGRRLAADWPTNRLSVRSPRDLADRLVPAMGHLEREELRVVLLNTKNAVLAIETVYVGNVSTALVRIGELFRDAVRQHAAGLILVHNPSLRRPGAQP